MTQVLVAWFFMITHAIDVFSYKINNKDTE